MELNYIKLHSRCFRQHIFNVIFLHFHAQLQCENGEQLI